MEALKQVRLFLGPSMQSLSDLSAAPGGLEAHVPPTAAADCEHLGSRQASLSPRSCMWGGF